MHLEMPSRLPWLWGMGRPPPSHRLLGFPRSGPLGAGAVERAGVLPPGRRPPGWRRRRHRGARPAAGEGDEYVGRIGGGGAPSCFCKRRKLERADEAVEVTGEIPSDAMHWSFL